LSCILEEIDYEEARQYLPPESRTYLDSIEDESRLKFMLNRYHRLIYTKEERRENYRALRALGYTREQAIMLRDCDCTRLHRILNEEIKVIFVTHPERKHGRPVVGYIQTINLTGERCLNNFHNIDKVHVRVGGGR
jgi:hypothetical protein